MTLVMLFHTKISLRNSNTMQYYSILCYMLIKIIFFSFCLFLWGDIGTQTQNLTFPRQMMQHPVFCSLFLDSNFQYQDNRYCYIILISLISITCVSFIVNAKKMLLYQFSERLRITVNEGDTTLASQCNTWVEKYTVLVNFMYLQN